MTDSEALDFLEGKLQTKAAIADALKVKPQRLSNWYERGISAEMRPAVWAMVNDHGGNLSRDWLLPKRKAAQQHAA
jgi:hypothetical protein